MATPLHTTFLHRPTILANPKPLFYAVHLKSLPVTCIGGTGAKEGTARSGSSSKHSPRRRRSPYGTSRRSIIKKTFSQEQVNFSSPVSEDPVVGIIGGGISGLMCASTLEKTGIRSTVFDTGMHGLGGRLGTRTVDPQSLVFDHAAQFFTVKDPQFQAIVDEWVNMGLICEWKGLIGELEKGGCFTPLNSSSTPYIGVKGMQPLADSIITQGKKINVVRPCWISKIEPFNGMWHLSENGKPCGSFDAIVIAHNGKCANRLLSSSGLPLLTRQMKKLELSSIWALLAAFEEPLPMPQNLTTSSFEGAFVKGIDSLSWMANNTKKLRLLQIDMPECWTFFSSALYGKQNKVPQENIPTATAEKIKRDMLEGVELALGLPRGSFKLPIYTRVQLWGAALPTNTPGIPFIFDPHGRAGICGDWLHGSSVEAAVLSGLSLANHIASYFKSGGIQKTEYAVGLDQPFEPLIGHDIGQFPGLTTGEPVDIRTKQAANYQVV